MTGPTDCILKGAQVYVAGHTGMAGSAIVSRLQSYGCTKLAMRTHAELDLTSQKDVFGFFEAERPEHVVLAAAKVGGILANQTSPADFIYENLAIQTNVIGAAHRTGVRRLLFLGSSAVFPRNCAQPMSEEHLFTGPPETTTRPYAMAKLAGMELCWSFNRQYGTQFVAVLPTNLYGRNDHYDPHRAHVIPGLLRKMHEAKLRGDQVVEVWGTGDARREFLHADDMADACVFLLSLPDEALAKLVGAEQAPVLNIGWGEDLSVRELAEMVRDVVGFEGKLVFDASKPDGAPRKLLDVSRMCGLGWKASIPLRAGLEDVYRDFLRRNAEIASRES